MRDRLRLQPNDSDAWVLRAAVVHAVAQVPEPGGQGRRVVLLDDGRVGDDGGGAGDRGPGAADGVEEGHVSFLRVHGQVEGFAGEEVRVEDEVDAAVFLDGSVWLEGIGESEWDVKGGMYLSSQSHASRG